jgi:hypothetical protein
MSDEESAGSSDEGQKPKKRKIDLKARLSNVRATGSMAAMPRGSEDPLAFPPPQAGQSVPAPKMLSAQGQAFTPSFSSAFAPPEPEVKPTIEQQTIKIDETEIHEERKQASKKSRVYVLIGLLLGLLAGGGLGTVYERTNQGRAAVKGASALGKEVKAATDNMKEFSHQLTKAMEAFGNETYPDDLVAFLQKTNIDFDATKFKDKGVGGLPADLLRTLIQFTQGVEDLNKKKKSLLNQLGSKNAKEAITKFWVTRKDPVVNFSVLLDKRGEDYFAILSINKEPFSQKGSPPAKYKITRPPSGQEKEGKELEGKRLLANAKSFEDGNILPVDESSVAKFTSQQAIAQFVVVMGDTLALMEGRKDPSNPDNDTPGLIKSGDEIGTALGKIGR